MAWPFGARQGGSGAGERRCSFRHLEDCWDREPPPMARTTRRRGVRHTRYDGLTAPQGCADPTSATPHSRRLKPSAAEMSGSGCRRFQCRSGERGGCRRRVPPVGFEPTMDLSIGGLKVRSHRPLDDRGVGSSCQPSWSVLSRACGAMTRWMGSRSVAAPADKRDRSATSTDGRPPRMACSSAAAPVAASGTSGTRSRTCRTWSGEIGDSACSWPR
jgi:hypothetical protein